MMTNIPQKGGSPVLEYADLAEYVERAKAQDECAFTYLYEKTCLMVYNIACTMLQDEEEAKDVVSEVYIRVFRHIASLEDNRSFIRWLIVITQRVCQDHKTKWDNLPDSIERITDLEDPNDLIAEWQQKETLRTVMQSLIRQLPQAQQRAIYCVYFKQLSVAQTAALEDCSVNTILSRLYYARNTLRRAILAEEKRTGDKYHLPVATAALSALMALPQVGFTLSPEEAAKILVSVFTALGVQYAGEKAPPIVTIVQEDDNGKRRSILIKLRPIFLGFLAVFGLTMAILLIGLGYTHGRRTQAQEVPMPADATVSPEATPTAEGTASPPPKTAPTEPQTISVNGISYTYTVENASATITAAELDANADRSAMESLVIPATLDGWRVTAIGAHAFSDNPDIASLYLPEGLETIGQYAFYGCPKLTAVSLPNSLRKIDQWSFAYCKALPEIDLPEGLETIGGMAFMHCDAMYKVTLPESLTFMDYQVFGFNNTISTIHLPAALRLDLNKDPAFSRMTGLREITVSPDNPQLCAVDGVLYSKEMDVLVMYPAERPDSHFTVPETVTRIGNFALPGKHMTSITLPQGLQKIGGWCFSYNSSLRQVTIPASVSAIGANAFGAEHLEEIRVEENSEFYRTENGVLYDRAMTRLICYPAAKPDLTYTIPDTVKTLAPYAICQNPYITQISMGDSVTTLNTHSISTLPALTALRLSDNIKNLPAYSIQDNDSITEYVMPKNLSSIDKSALQSCAKLVRVVFQGDSISYSPSLKILLQNKNCVFAYPGTATGWTEEYWTSNYNMEPYALPSETPTRVEPTEPQTASINGIIYTYTVANGTAAITAAEPDPTASETAMAELLVPAKLDGWPVTAIGSYAFASNESIRTLILQAPLSEIGTYAFNGCSALTSARFPDTLQKIGDHAFGNCSSLEALSLPEGLTHIGLSAFAKCTALPAITFPDSLIEIGANILQGNDKITRLHLPAQVKIGVTDNAAPAFADMPALQAITVDPANPQLCAVDGVLYTKDKQVLLAYPNDKPGAAFTIPASVKRIGQSAIASRHLISLILNSGLEEIDNYAFNACTKLTSIHIPASVTYIRPNAFGAPALTEITVADSSRDYRSVDGILYNKDMTELLRYPAAKPGSAFTIPDGVTTIISSAFCGTAQLQSLSMSDSVRKIDPYALSEMPSLTSLRLSDSITYLSDRALAANDRITTYTMPKQLTAIEKTALQSCPRLTCIQFQGNAISYNWSIIISLQNKDCVLTYPRYATGWSDAYWRKHYALVPYDQPTAEEPTSPIPQDAPNS